MLTHVLICPSQCRGVAGLAKEWPIATLPILGSSLLEYWASHLAEEGPSKVMVVAQDRSAEVRQKVGAGERWGLEITVQSAADIDATPQEAILLDHFPGMEDRPLLGSYRDWFAGVIRWIPYARTPDRVGIEEIEPGIWVSQGARVSSKAELRGPCWIGANVIVGRHSTIGPQAVLEKGCLIEDHCEISCSHLGESAYVAPYSELRHSLVVGGTVIDWVNNSELPLSDPLILSSLRRPDPRKGQVQTIA